MSGVLDTEVRHLLIRLNDTTGEYA